MYLKKAFGHRSGVIPLLLKCFALRIPRGKVQWLGALALQVLIWT